MRYLLFILSFFALACIGGLLSVGFYKDTIESLLVGSAREELKKSGFGDVDVSANHMFVSVQDDGRGSAMGDIIDKRVKGAYVLEQEPAMAWAQPIPDSDINVFMGDNGSVILSGLVPNDFIKKRYGDTISGAVQDAVVDNQLVVGNKVGEAKWLSGLPDFLGSYFKVPGVTGFKADNRGFTLDGKVASADLKNKVSAIADEMLGGFGAIKNRLSVVEMSPPSLKISPDGKDGYEVSGKLPRGGLKDSLLYAVNKALPGKYVKDSVEIGPDVSVPWWSENAKKLIPGFLKNSGPEGSLEFSSDKLHLNAGNADEAAYSEFLKIASVGKPEGFRITGNGGIKLENPPSDVDAGKTAPSLSMYRSRDGIINLDGQLATEEEKQQITKALESFGEINSKIKTGEDIAASPWKDPGQLFAAILNSPERVSARLFKDKVSFGGRAVSDKLMKSFEALAAKVMGSSGSVESKVRMVTKEILVKEDKMEDGFKETAVYFKTGSFAVSQEEMPKVKETAQNIISTGTDSPLIVGGYADMTGDAEQNRVLSLKRANSVRDQLIKLGVSEDRMDVRHFGVDVSNVAKSDLWKSRRVELSLGE